MSATTMHPAVFRSLQARFLTIPQAPLCYWLRERFFDLLSAAPVQSIATVRQGLVTGDDLRTIRFFWEVSPQVRSWVPHTKGGGYARWDGQDRYLVDWRSDGKRVELGRNPRFQNVDWYFRSGLWYSRVARNSIGARVLGIDAVIGVNGPGIFLHGHADTWEPEALAAILNSRLSTFIARSISQSIVFQVEQVSRLPLPTATARVAVPIARACFELKRWLLQRDPTERSFVHGINGGVSLTQAHGRATEESVSAAAVLHAFEGLSEREVLRAYDLSGEDIAAVLDETGTPAGWFPLIAGYDMLPELPKRMKVSPALFEPLSREPRRTLPPEELAGLKKRLRAFYEAEPDGEPADQDNESYADQNHHEENEAAGSGARIPIPTETFLEELSQRVEVHPISVYWLLRELREKEGAVSSSELRRFVEEYLSVAVLRLLGHRWPREIESGEPLPAWVDTDGVIALTGGTGEPTLLERVRERITEDFGPSRVNVIEQELEQITGKPLGAWLATEFFQRHISQFRKRPIAWHIESARSNGKRGRRGKRNAPPAFSCLLYYHRLDGDLLPKLRSQYVGPLRARFQTEFAGLERLETRTADQDERRVQLEMLLEELKDFDVRLEQVITSGFSSAALDAIAAKEPLDKWTSRDGQASHPTTWETLLAQERRYDPDLNDGVRVNIAPLQRAGLLAADVLAAKDIEKAIADRAQWRADERRWCREGKLPQPGWWPSKEAARSAPENRVEARR